MESRLREKGTKGGECERLRSCMLESKLFVTAASEFTRSYFRRSVAHCSIALPILACTCARFSTLI